MITIRRRFLLLPLILLPFGAFFLWLSTMPVEPVEPIRQRVDRYSVEKLWLVVNDWRESNGFQKYQEDQYLCEIADIRVKEIQNDYTHNGIKDKSQEFFYQSRFNRLGENLMFRAADEQDALEGWLDSPSHRSALESDFTHSCIRADGPFIVQIFAKY